MGWEWKDKTDTNEGLQWRWTVIDGVLYIFIPGTDHILDWWRHRKIKTLEAGDGIRVTRADLELTKVIIRFIQEIGLSVRVGGHSWGGGIAALITWICLKRGIPVHGFLYAPKQVGNKAFVEAIIDYITAYRHRGDAISYLMFWLCPYPVQPVGKFTWPWKAHMPSVLNYQIQRDGFR